MKNLTKTMLAASFMVALLFWNGCKKDKDEPVSDNNNPPVLNVGADVVGMTDVNSTLTVAASDPDGDALQITWNITQSPVGSDAIITSTSLYAASFITSVPGLYKVEVVADDGKGKNASGIVTLYIGGVLPTNISSNITYPNLFDNEDYPEYYAMSSAQITAGITLEPGVVIELASDVRLWFTGNSAYLNAEGTSTKNIIFRGVDKVPGSWNHIAITSNNVNNKLNYVNIHHAGSSKVSNQKTALFLQSNISAQISIRNTTITQSGGYAFYVDGDGGSITTFSDNNFSDNAAAPMRVGAPHLFSLDKNSVFTNNGIQAIEVSGGSYGFTEDGTVPSLSVPYHFYSNLGISAKITFEPGVACYFDQGKKVWVDESGTLIADGTETKKITFSGIEPSPGSWIGIEIHSPSSGNKINYGIVEYGGSTAGRGANIYLFGSSPGSQLTITNSHISDSQTWGIWATSGAVSLTENNNTFSNNASGNIRID